YDNTQVGMLDRLSDITDVLGTSDRDSNHTTSFEYDLRGQLTKTWLPNDPQPGGSRHSIINTYNADGTLQKKTDQLNHFTSYTYDDYKRLKSVTPPDRGDGLHTTSYFYDANGTTDDWTLTDSNARWVKLPSPSPKWTKNLYDDNRRKSSV